MTAAMAISPNAPLILVHVRMERVRHRGLGCAAGPLRPQAEFPATPDQLVGSVAKVVGVAGTGRRGSVPMVAFGLLAVRIHPVVGIEVAAPAAGLAAEAEPVGAVEPSGAASSALLLRIQG